MRLARDQHRIDDRAEVVDHEVAHHLDLAGVAVDLDLGDVAAVGERERRIVRDVADVERLRHVGRQAEARAQLVGQLEDADAAVGAGDGEAAARELDVDGRGFEHMGRDLLALLDQLVAGLEEGLAGDQRRLRAAGAAAHLELVGIALQQAEALERDAELAAQHLGEGRGVALAVVERAAQHGDRAVGLEADAAILLGRRPGDLEIGADAAAAQLVARRALGLALVEALPVGGDQRLVEHGGELARIVVHARRRLVGHLRRARCGCAAAARPGRCPSRAPPCRSGAPCSSCPRAGRRRDRRRSAWCW